MFEVLSYLAIAFMLSSLLTPAVRRLAIVVGVVDAPDDRKVHVSACPRLGGAAIAISFLACLALVTQVDGARTGWARTLAEGDPYALFRSHPFGVRFFVGCLVVFLLGAWDDWQGTGARVKLFWQTIAAVAVLYDQPRFGVLQALGCPCPLLDLLLGAFWVSYVCNAFNLVDGLDGLAAGTAFCGCLGLFALAWTSNNEGMATLLAILAGATLAFLQYNRHPARIFMGDSGSLFLGFCLAVFSLRLFSALAPQGALALAPLVALGLPLADTTLALVRRWLRFSNVLDRSKPFRLLPLTSLFTADRGHIHHRMLDALGSHRRAVNALLIIDTALAAMVVGAASFSRALGPWGLGALYGIVVLGFYAMLKRLGYGDMFAGDKGSV